MDKEIKKKLKRIIINAHKHSPFYREKYKDVKLCYSAVPILHKMEIREAEEKNEIGEEFENAIISYTSGSTGIPLKVQWNPKDYQMSNFELWYYRKKWYDISPQDKYVTFFSYNTNDLKFVNRDYYIENNQILYLRRCNYNEEQLEKYMQIIKAFSPRWIQIPGSLFWVLFEYIRKTNQKIEELAYLELNGEYVSNIEFVKIVNFCKKREIKVANLYGAVEVNGIALTCPEHRFHILKNNVYLDINKEMDSEELIVTSLYNTHFPIIKYALGDFGKIIHNKKCKCGLCADLLELNYGRGGELIQLKYGDRIDERMFFNIIMQAERRFGDIYRYHVTNNGEKVSIYIYTSGRNNAEIKRFFDNNVYTCINCDIQVSVTIKSISESISERKPYNNEG